MILVVLAIFAVTAPQSGYRSTLYLLLLNHFGVCSSFSIAQFLYICNVHCCPFPQVPFSSSECFPGTFLEFSFFLFFCDPEVHCKVASQICPFSMKKLKAIDVSPRPISHVSSGFVQLVWKLSKTCYQDKRGHDSAGGAENQCL